MSTNWDTQERFSRDILDMDPPHAGRSNDGSSFLIDPENGAARASDDLGEEIAEDFLLAATSGQSANQDMTEAEEMDELGGPFIETTLEQELALSRDELDPEDVESAPDSSWNGDSPEHVPVF